MKFQVTWTDNTANSHTEIIKAKSPELIDRKLTLKYEDKFVIITDIKEIKD